jgi:hypothetical protein
MSVQKARHRFIAVNKETKHGTGSGIFGISREVDKFRALSDVIGFK